jgi:hypothetical protein
MHDYAAVYVQSVSCVSPRKFELLFLIGCHILRVAKFLHFTGHVQA